MKNKNIMGRNLRKIRTLNINQNMRRMLTKTNMGKGSLI